MKFHENPSIGSRVVSSERTDGQADIQTHRQAIYMAKLIIAFSQFGESTEKLVKDLFLCEHTDPRQTG
jgi:hypothetical protein